MATRKKQYQQKRRNNAFDPDLLESQAGAVASSPDVRKLFGELLEHTYGSPVGWWQSESGWLSFLGWRDLLNN